MHSCEERSAIPLDPTGGKEESSVTGCCSNNKASDKDSYICASEDHASPDKEIQAPLFTSPVIEKHGSCCFTSRKQLVIPKDLPKHVRKYYKDQNAVIERLEDVWLNVENCDESHLDDEKRTAKTASILSKVTFAANVMLLAAKAVAAGLSSSLSMLSSMLDSAMDLVSGALMWWSNRAIKNTNYSLYPRGRRKLEPVAIVVLAVIMSFVSVQVIHESIQKVVVYATRDNDNTAANVRTWLSTVNVTDYNSSSDSAVAIYAGVVEQLLHHLDDCSSSSSRAPIFEAPTIAICVATIVTKLVLFLVCRRIKNQSVQALAKDHFNDVISNTAAIACGILGYKVWKYADPIGAIVISISIIISWSVTAYGQIKVLTGYTARPDFIQKVTWIVLNHDARIQFIESVIAFHFGNRFLVEVSIVLPGDMSMRESHDLCEMLQRKIERLPEVERAFVHIDYECDWIAGENKSARKTKRKKKKVPTATLR